MGDAGDTSVLGGFVDTAVGRTAEDGENSSCFCDTALVAHGIGGCRDRRGRRTAGSRDAQSTGSEEFEELLHNL